METNNNEMEVQNTLSQWHAFMVNHKLGSINSQKIKLKNQTQ